MPSPFPGMDPYLEQSWGDVHHRLITYAADQLQSCLPGELKARVQERVFVEAQTVRRTVYPDIRVVERLRSRSARARGGTALAMEPLVIKLPDEPLTEGFIEIIDIASGRRVVTVVEILSPANKCPGPGQELYLRKQRELLQAGVSLVEIDLLRTGEWIVAVPRSLIPVRYRSTYRTVIRRGWTLNQVELYPMPLEKRLPVIGIPLREKDDDAALDLQAIVNQCYSNGDYEDIDYAVEPDPPLERAQARWADRLLQGAGLRPGKKRK